LSAKDKEDAEAARGRAGLEAILKGLPAVPDAIIDATPQFAADRKANRAGNLSPLQRFQQLYRMGVEKLMALPGRKEGPTRAQIAATLGQSPKQTSKPNESGAVETVTDIDGNVYQTVRIGSQIWMKENLKATRLNDGTAISSISDEAKWRVATAPACCLYSNSHEGVTANYKEDYGLLYNGYAVTSGKLAPAGWRVPTQAEWDSLVAHLGGLGVAGGKMKETLVYRIKEVTLKDPILVEGLPGVGHVGKLVADHMVEELKAEKKAFKTEHKPDFKAEYTHEAKS
jgi:uncharacterized protein (TIGR02145 family)